MERVLNGYGTSRLQVIAEVSSSQLKFKCILLIEIDVKKALSLSIVSTRQSLEAISVVV